MLRATTSETVAEAETALRATEIEGSRMLQDEQLPLDRALAQAVVGSIPAVRWFGRLTATLT